MPGPLLHVGAIVTCAHGGQAQPLVPNPRVLINGAPAVTLASPYAVAGCGQAILPCVMAQYVLGATRVFADGVPVLLQDSQAVCAPTGTPLLAVGVQPRVIGM